jgi:hypothetical protein
LNAIRLRAPLAAAALACLFTSSPSFAQAAASGPWAKVPALSTLCYSFAGEDREPFYGKLEAAKAVIQADREKQDAINAKIQEEYQNIDPMEMASRMQQWMMSNPDEAMKFMQGQQAMAEAVPQELDALAKDTQAREAEWNALVKSYEDALIQAYAPVEARYSALLGQKRTDRKELLYPRFMGDPSNSQAEWAEGAAINAAADQAYQTLCPQWWGANGKFPAYLKRQKDWFTQKRIPDLARIDAPKLQQYAIMNTPAASYRSTAELQGVAEYLDLVWKVFDERDSQPRCNATHTCDGAHP